MTKNDILNILLAAYSGPGSTAEGSFAGDVLRACADAMAELWSMEIDGLERRAFVSTATGEWLTAVCADRGVIRRENETDESLRQRTLAKLSSQPASGNVDHYAAWCLETDELLRVRVLPLYRGVGTVDIIAVGMDGKAPAQAALDSAQAAVDSQRPIGADALVRAATEVPLQIAATLVLQDGASLSGVQTAFEETLSVFCKETALLTTTISYAKVLRLLLETPGVADVTAFTLCGSDQSLSLAVDAVAVTGTAALEEAVG